MLPFDRKNRQAFGTISENRSPMWGWSPKANVLLYVISTGVGQENKVEPKGLRPGKTGFQGQEVNLKIFPEPKVKGERDSIEDTGEYIDKEEVVFVKKFILWEVIMKMYLHHSKSVMICSTASLCPSFTKDYYWLLIFANTTKI